MDSTDGSETEDGTPESTSDDPALDSIQDAVEPVEDLELAEIGIAARALDVNRTVRERM